MHYPILALFGALLLATVPGSVIAACPPLDDTCCECTYSGPADGGGSVTCEVHKQCNSNQTAACNCSGSGCTSSCSTHTNQGSVSTDDTIYEVELHDTVLKGICRWVVGMDRTWQCEISGTPPTTSHTQTLTETKTFGGYLDELAGLYNRCAEVDSVNKTIEFRPLGFCL